MFGLCSCAEPAVARLSACIFYLNSVLFVPCLPGLLPGPLLGPLHAQSASGSDVIGYNNTGGSTE
jgi:hypothetical protein